MRTYTFDEFNNRTQKQETEKETIQYTYSNLNQLVETTQGNAITTYHCDKRGNLTEVKVNGNITQTYAFDSANKMSKAVIRKGNLSDSTAGKTVTTKYTYDGSGNRINGVVYSDGKMTSNTTYLVDLETSNNNIILAKDSVSGEVSQFTFADEVISVESFGNISYYKTDEKYSVTDILDATGRVQAAIEYDEYGGIENPEVVSIGGNVFAYTGHVYDENTGLYYAKARYYNAEIGRFISKDTYLGNIKDPNTLNPYIYGNQNPYKYTDPSGHIAISVVAKLGTGALFDMGMQFVANYYFNSKTAGKFKASFHSINWWQVTSAGVQNLFHVKNKALEAVITGFGDVIVNWMKQGEKYSCEKALRDFAMGFLSDIAARYVSKFGAKAVAKGMKKMGVNPAKIKRLTGVDLSDSKSSAKSSSTSQSKTNNNRPKVSAGACFVAGTQIKTREGSKNIEDIRCGDYVLAEDPETGELAYKEVVQTFVRDTDKTIHVRADGIEIETTSEHPFWVEGKGFVSADSLHQGDVLRLSTGENAKVEHVWEDVLEEKVLVYNFEVEDFHTYFVSELGVLVHNTCSWGGSVSKYLEQLDNLPENKVNHIINRSQRLGHDHKWDCLVEGKDWSKIKKIICNVMENGTEYPSGSASCKVMKIKGYEVEVRFKRLSDGTVRISDAFVR